MDALAGFDALQIGAALVAAFVAAFIRGLAGFGLAILLVPVLALVLAPVEAVLVTNALAVLLGLSEAPRLVREADRSAWPLAALTFAFTFPGFWALAAAPPDIARLIIAAVALAAFGAVLVPASRSAGALGRVPVGFAGAGSGLATGFAGMPGAAIVPFYMRTGLPRAAIKPSMLLIFTVAAATGFLAGVLTGEARWSHPVLAGLLLPIVWIGNRAGAWGFGRVSDALWRTVVAVILGASALAALLRV